MVKIRKKIFRSYLKTGFQGLSALLFVAVVYFGVNMFCNWRAVNRTTAYISGGYNALAADFIDDYRYSVVRTEQGCRVLLQAYFLAKRMDRLQWAAEACVEAKNTIPEVYLATSAVQEATGTLDEALRVLSVGAAKFGQNAPAIHARMAALYKKARRMDEAKNEMLIAVAQAPADDQMTLNALQFFLEAKFVAETKQMADKLRNVPGASDPEIKLVLAKAYKSAGDEGSSQSLISEARSLASTTPEVLQRLEKNYPDLLKSPSPKELK